MQTKHTDNNDRNNNAFIAKYLSSYSIQQRLEYEHLVLSN